MNSNGKTGINKSPFSPPFPYGELNFALIKDNSGVITATVIGLVDRKRKLATLAIPDTVEFGSVSYPVTTIGDQAFAGCSGLTSLTFPTSLTAIGYSAFHSCSGLTSLTLPDNLIAIGDQAFCGCKGLINLTLPVGLIEIGDEAFSDCKGLTSLTLPVGLTEIGDEAFSDCKGLTSLTLPADLAEIGDEAFSGCSNLTGLILPDGLVAIGNRAFYSCKGLKSVCLLSTTPPDLGFEAFHDVPLAGKSIDTPSGCKFICPKGCLGIYQADEDWKDYFAAGCGSESTTSQPVFRKGRKEAKAFDDSGLNFVLVKDDDGDTTATVTGFAGDVIADLTILPTVKFKGKTYRVTAIGNSAFRRTDLISMNLPSSLTTIGNKAFFDCSSLSGSLTLPENLTKIGAMAFTGCSGLTGSLKLPEGLTKIGIGAFFGCSGLSGSLKLPENLTKIRAIAFAGCSGLSGSLTLPEGLTKIGDKAFYNCSGLGDSLTFPKSLTKIGDAAFDGCSGLISFTFLSSMPPDCTYSSFYGISKGCKFICPKEHFDDYKKQFQMYFLLLLSNNRQSSGYYTLTTSDGTQVVPL